MHEMDLLFTARRSTLLLHGALAVLASLLLAVTLPASAESARQIKKQNDPLVRSLEGLYAKSMDTARAGDFDAYWRWRTASSRERPPRLTKSLLPLFAGMLPALGTLQFVRMDAAGQMARDRPARRHGWRAAA